jgi:hypothetical protein
VMSQGQIFVLLFSGEQRRCRYRSALVACFSYYALFWGYKFVGRLEIVQTVSTIGHSEWLCWSSPRSVPACSRWPRVGITLRHSPSFSHLSILPFVFQIPHRCYAFLSFVLL